MKIFGYVLIKEKEYNRNLANFAELYAEKYTDARYHDGKRDGVKHVIDSLKMAVTKENINHVWRINHNNIEDLKFLVNALLGTYAKKKGK